MSQNSFTTKFNEQYLTNNDCNLFCKYVKRSTPTVIFEAGLGDSHSTWRNIQHQVSSFASTFSYDRAGVGKSDKTYTPREGANMVSDLVSILEEASLPKPYILVGHSFGGILVRLFANKYPELVKGVVLLDTATEFKELFYEKVLSEEQRLENLENLNNPMKNMEKINKVKCYEEITACKDLFDIPLMVIIRGLPDTYDLDLPNEELLFIDQSLQIELKKSSTKGKILFADKSRHYIHEDQPELVIEQIKNLVTDNKLEEICKG